MPSTTYRVPSTNITHPHLQEVAWHSVDKTKYDTNGQRIHRYGKLLWKREAALDSWALRIQRHLDEIRSVWTFANNHYEGFAPETCQRLAQRLGFELPLPVAAAAEAPHEHGQLDLFAEAPPA